MDGTLIAGETGYYAEVTSDGKLKTETSLTAVDIQIGAVEIKNATTDARAIVTTGGALSVVGTAGTALMGKVGIDQATANANEVVTKTGSITTATLGAGTALAGKFGIDQTTPGTTNKVTIEGMSASVYSTTVLAASGVIKGSAGKLIGISGINNAVAAQYIQVFNSATVPANATAPIAVCYVPAASNFSIDFSLFGLTCAAGISWSNSSTLATKTIGAADCWVTGIYI